MVTVEELRWDNLSTAQQWVVHSTYLAFIEKKKKRHCWKKIHNKSCFQFATSHDVDIATCGRKYFTYIRPKLLGLNAKLFVWWKTKPCTSNTPNPQWNMVAAESCCEDSSAFIGSCSESLELNTKIKCLERANKQKQNLSGAEVQLPVGQQPETSSQSYNRMV